MRIAPENGTREPAPKCCLLETLAPQLKKEIFLPQAVTALPDGRPVLQLSPILRDLSVFRSQHPCRHELERCPLYAILRGGAMAGGWKVLGAITDAYAHWFFEFWMPRMTDDVASVIRMLQKRSENAAERFFERLGRSIDNASTSRAELKLINERLASATRSLAQSRPDLPDQLGPEWQQCITDTAGLVHDIGNIISSYAMGISYAKMQKDPADAMVMLSTLQSLDFSSVHSIANLVAMVNASRAQVGKVTVEVGKMPKIVLDEGVRVSLFRLLNELITNAIKYHDDDKPEKLACIEIFFRRGIAYLYVIDNGVGFNDTDDLFAMTPEGTHAREHPELAEGEGRGLATVEQLVRHAEWGFSLISGKRIGTMAGIYLNPEKCKTWSPVVEANSRRKRPSVRPSGATLPRGIFMHALDRIGWPSAQIAGAQLLQHPPLMRQHLVSRRLSIAGHTLSAFQFLPLSFKPGR